MVLNTPVLIILFNRPQKTKKLFDALRMVKPIKLYISCDGPRNDKDLDKIGEVQNVVETELDWECDVKKLYRSENFGCGPACKSAIDWLFDSEEEGIILEDDCIPGESFFSFCESLLAKYRDNKQVMHIGGFNMFDVQNPDGDYFFSIYPRVWGWASWRSSWLLMKHDITDEHDQMTRKNLLPLFNNHPFQSAFWEVILHKMSNSQNPAVRNVWDYMWTYTIRKHHGLCVAPNKNLVKNIGFDEEGTHTSKMGPFKQKVLNADAVSIDLPLRHPEKIAINEHEDLVFFKNQLIDSNWKFFKIYMKRLFPFLKPLKG